MLLAAAVVFTYRAIGEAVARSALPATTNHRRPSLTLYQPSSERFFRADSGYISPEKSLAVGLIQVDRMIKRHTDGGDLRLRGRGDQSYSFSIFICEVHHRPAVTPMVKIRQMAPLYEINKVINMV